MILKIAPLAEFSTAMLPRCASIVFLAIDKPRPVPFALVVEKGSNKESMMAAGALVLNNDD